MELASDHREFATALAKTKLAEMSGKAKIVPIPQPPPPKPQPVPANVAVTSSLNSLPPPPFAVQTRPTGRFIPEIISVCCTMTLLNNFKVSRIP